MLQVGNEAEFTYQGLAEFLKVMRAEVEGAEALTAYHVVVEVPGEGQLVVEPVPDLHLGNHPGVLEEAQRAVDGGQVHVLVGLPGTPEHFVYTHMAAPVSDDRKHQDPLWGDPVSLDAKHL